MKKVYLSLIITAILTGSVSWAATDTSDTALFQESKIEAQSLDDKNNVKEFHSQFDDNNFSITISDGLRYRESINKMSEDEYQQYLKDFQKITADALNSAAYKNQIDKKIEKLDKEEKKANDQSSFFLERKEEAAKINNIIQEMNNKRYTLNLYRIESDVKKDNKNLQVKSYVKIEDSLLNSENSVRQTLATYGNVSLVNALGFNQALLGQIGLAQFMQPTEGDRLIEMKYQYQLVMDRNIPYMELKGYLQSEVFIKSNTKIRLDDYKNHIINTIQSGNISYLLILEEQ